MTCECKCDCNYPCTCEKCKLNPDGQMSSLKKFEIALQTRNFEIEMFWKRSNYFLVLNTAIAVGFVSLIKEGGYINVDVLSYTYALFFCFIGWAVCIAWTKVNLGSKFWQSYWEELLTNLSDDMGLDYFAKSYKNNNRVMNNLRDTKHKLWERYYNHSVLEKPSVSKWMTALSFFFLCVWFVAGLIISYAICWVFFLVWIISASLGTCLMFPKLKSYISNKCTRFTKNLWKCIKPKIFFWQKSE